MNDTNTSDAFGQQQLAAGFWRLQDWQFSDQELVDYIEQCLEFGIQIMDHARVYKSEALFGRALKRVPSLRDEMFIVSKCGIRLRYEGQYNRSHVNHYDSSSTAIIDSVNASLADLHTDRLDCLLIHRPDYLMQADEIAEAFATLQQQGKVLNFGVSNFSPAQMSLLASATDHALLTNQVELSPFATHELDSGVFELCQQQRMRPMLWSCLGGGRLFDQTLTDTQRLVPVLESIAQSIGASSIDQVVYAWLLALPSKPIPIIGSRDIERVRAARNALDLTLNREQWYSIWEAAMGHSVP